MAKTPKTVKKATPTSRARRKPAARKRPARTPRKAPARARPSRGARTTVTALAELLPTPVGENEYVSRTVTILEQDQRRRARSRATRAKQLEQVVGDVKRDVTLRLDGVEQSALQTLEELSQRVRSIGLVQQAVALPDQVTGQVTDAVDSVLDRLGLMRRSLHEETLASRPARRRRRKAA